MVGKFVWQFIEPLVVFFRDKERVAGGFGPNIQKGNEFVVLVRSRGRNLARHDFAENTGIHTHYVSISLMFFFNYWKIIILSVIVLGVLGGVGYVYFHNTATDRFKSYDVAPFDCVSPDYWCNVRLIGVNDSGTQVVVEENLTELFRAKNGGSDGLIIDKFYFPENSNELIFVKIVASSGCCELYKYNVSTKVFSENGRVYTMEGGEEPSSDKSTLIRFEDDQLLVVDVFTNTVIATVLPSDGETFIKGISGYGSGPYGEYTWIDQNTFSYNVYKEGTIPPIDSEDTLTLIEAREYTVAR